MSCLISLHQHNGSREPTPAEDFILEHRTQTRWKSVPIGGYFLPATKRTTRVC
jgi:hypothetical protein